MSETDSESVREAVAVFHDETSLQAAIYDLETHGFDRAEISLLAPVSAVDEKLGRNFVSAASLEDDPKVPTIAFTSPESLAEAEGALAGGLLYVGALAGIIPIAASGGTLAAGLIAGAIGGGVGASIGAVLASLLGKHHAEYVEEQLKRGGLLLWVRTWNKGDEARAVEILSSHSGDDVHVHELPKASDIFHEKFPDAARSTYRGATYLHLENGAFVLEGEFFASEHAVTAFLDRRHTVGSMRSELDAEGFGETEALIDPSSVFDKPADVLKSGLSDPLKRELLKRWAYDVKREQCATSEGMPAGQMRVTLEDVEQALLQLDR